MQNEWDIREKHIGFGGKSEGNRVFEYAVHGQR
jgi:hypothetical protein